MGEIELGAAAEATIQAYKELATDPSKRLALALDRTCIQFLAYVVAEGEDALVQAAVETLASIAQTKDCQQSLANTFGVMEALQSVIENEEGYNKELQDQAADLFMCLQYARHIKQKPKEDKKEGDTCKLPSTLKEKNEEKVDENNTPTEKKHEVETMQKKTKGITREGSSMKNAMEKKESFLGPHNSRAKIVKLFIKGMVTAEHRKLVEEELVRVRGLISIVFDLSRSQVTCRVMRDLAVEKLAVAVARTETLTALQVTTNAKGEEEVIPLDCSSSTQHPTVLQTPYEDLPDYLPEEDPDVIDATSAMAPTGSLLEKATSWFSSASSLLQKSFYW